MFEIGYMPEWFIFVVLMLLIIPITVGIYKRDEYDIVIRVLFLWVIGLLFLLFAAVIGIKVDALTFTTNDYTAVAPGPEFLQSKMLNEEKASAFIEESTQVYSVSVSNADAPEGSTTIALDENTAIDFTGIKDGKKISGSFDFKDNSMIITFNNGSDSTTIVEPLDN